MKLLFIILNKEEYLDEVLEAFLELGLRGATVIDSVGMGRILAYEIPIFAGLRSLLPGNRPFNKTIFTLVEEEKIPDVITAVEQIIGPLENPGTGIAFAIPVDFVKGLSPSIE
ncbi:MAG: hypothetical protein Q9P14_18240 [candidate division KSB1 bacterium]|nr:hypothetical protein [candidate division KSB1 bacterium]MDQ7063496.1 hypothetical protein [candidate division KSB1 bacterium]